MAGILRIFALTALALVGAFALIRADSARAQTAFSITPVITNVTDSSFDLALSYVGTPRASPGAPARWIARMCYQSADDLMIRIRDGCGGARILTNTVETAFTSSSGPSFPTANQWFVHASGGLGGTPLGAQGFSTGSETLQPSRRYAMEILYFYYPFAGNSNTRHTFYSEITSFTVPTTNRPAVTVSNITATDADFAWTPGDFTAFPPFGWTLALRYAGVSEPVARWDNSGQDDSTKFAQRTASADGPTAGVSFTANPSYTSTDIRYPVWGGELEPGTHYTITVEAYTSAYAGRATLPATPYLESLPAAFQSTATAESEFLPLYATATARAQVDATATAEVMDAQATETAVAGEPFATATAAAQATAAALTSGNPMGLEVLTRSGTDVTIRWQPQTIPAAGSNRIYYGLWVRQNHYTYSQNRNEVQAGPSTATGLEGYRFFGALDSGSYTELLTSPTLTIGTGMCHFRRFASNFWDDDCRLPDDAIGPLAPLEPFTVYAEAYWLSNPYDASRRAYHADTSTRSFLSIYSSSAGVGPTPTPIPVITTPTPRAYPTLTPTPQPRPQADPNFEIPFSAGRVINTDGDAIAGVRYGRCTLPDCIRAENDNRSVSFLSSVPPALDAAFVLDSATLSAAGTKTRIAQIDVRYTTPTETDFDLDIPAPSLTLGALDYQFQGREPILQSRGRAQAVSFRYDLGQDFPSGAHSFHTRIYWNFGSGLPVYLTVDAVILRIQCDGCEFVTAAATPTPLPITAGLDMRDATVPRLSVGGDVRLTPPERPEYVFPFMEPVADGLEQSGISANLMFGIVAIVIAVFAGSCVMVTTKNLLLGAGTILIMAAVATTPLFGVWTIGLVILVAIVFTTILLWTQSHQV